MISGFGHFPLTCAQFCVGACLNAVFDSACVLSGVEEQVEGVSGDACLQLTDRLEAALGTVEQRQPTAEAFNTPQVLTQLQSQSVEPS